MTDRRAIEVCAQKLKEIEKNQKLKLMEVQKFIHDAINNCLKDLTCAMDYANSSSANDSLEHQLDSKIEYLEQQSNASDISNTLHDMINKIETVHPRDNANIEIQENLLVDPNIALSEKNVENIHHPIYTEQVDQAQPLTLVEEQANGENPQEDSINEDVNVTTLPKYTLVHSAQKVQIIANETIVSLDKYITDMVDNKINENLSKLNCKCNCKCNKIKCNLCSRTFSFPSQLKAHVVSHSKEKPYKCSHCFKFYPHEQSLKSHTKRMHEDAMPNK